MAFKKKRKLSKKEEKAKKKAEVLVLEKAKTKTKTKTETETETETKTEGKIKKIIEIPEIITVRDFASRLATPVTEVIKTLMKNGILATINQNIDWETASIVGEDLGYTIKLEEEKESRYGVKDLGIEEKKKGKEKLEPRPPVITIMGHVDHGKTQLLDTIRKTNVIATESGRITQHIGAYQITHKGRKITFIDTPGHEAFTAMRAHGANITDIVVLVVAADEGVKPQTIEAYGHAKAANVPIIVAINKIDLPHINIQKTKKQLSEIGLLCEDMGGKTICLPISALQNKNIDELLEMILLLSDLKEYKAEKDAPATGRVIESHLDPNMGPVASLLIQNGTLRKGDFLVAGETWGKIRTLEDENKKRLEEAGPGTPVSGSGLEKLPSFSDIFQVVPDERSVKKILFELKKAIPQKREGKELKVAEIKELPLILKTDVLGSEKAILDSLEKMLSENKIKKVGLEIIFKGIGNITESDVMLAQASNALILGFRVSTSRVAKEMAERENVKILHHRIIYELIEDVQVALKGLLEKEVVWVKKGQGKILRIFRKTKKEKIIGLDLLEGEIEKGFLTKIKREGEEIGQGRITSLQIEKEKVDKVKAKKPCGIGLETDIDLEEGDELDFFQKETRIRKLE